MDVRLGLVGMAVLVLSLATGCSPTRPSASQGQPVQSLAQQQEKEAKMGWTLTSSAFKDGERIPPKYTCEGDNISPPLSWADAPARAVEFALICDDPDAPAGTFVHWVLYGLPAKTTSLPEGVPITETLPQFGGAKQGKHSGGRIGYTGPCPPAGPVHHYHFRLYALDAKLDLAPGATAKDLRQLMEKHTIGTVELVGLYSR